MKKIIILSMILLLTGCTTDYNLTVNKDSITEDINVTIPKDVVSSDVLDSQFSSPWLVYENGKDVYDISRKSSSNNYFVNYKYKHDINKYSESSFIKKCYAFSQIKNTPTSFIINTDSTFNCIQMEDDIYMDEVRVNITTKLPVNSNNADVINGDTYTWIINDDNYNNKPIAMEIQKEVKLSDSSNESSPVVIFIIVILGLSIVLVFGYLLIKKKSDNSNSF